MSLQQASPAIGQSEQLLLDDVTIVHIACARGASASNNDIELTVFPKRVGDSLIFITAESKRSAPEKPRQALWHVTGLEEDPQKWKVSYFPLVEESVHANPSASALIEGDYLYIFTLYEQGSRSQILTRIPLKGLGDPKNSLQYLGSNDKWHDGIEPVKAKVVMNKGASEMSVRYHPELKKWLAVLVDPQIFSDKVLLRTAPSMTGPWTEGSVIYHIPELQKSNSGYDSDTFCYAGKEHPEFEKPGELLFTYVCNSMKPKKLEAETQVYFPQVVRMPMPQAAKE